MALFNFRKTVKPQRFNYIPRYYDPVKEERDARIRAAKGLSSDDPDAMKARIRLNFREKSRGSTKSQRNSATRRSNLILVATLVALLLLTYILLTRYLPQIEKALG